MDVVIAPFHVGIRDERVGRGPGRLLDAGLMEAPRDGGAAARLVGIGPVDRSGGGIARSVEVMRRGSRWARPATHGSALTIG